MKHFYTVATKVKFTVLILTILLIVSNSCKHLQKDKQSPPNIIFIMSDDHTTQAITAYDTLYKNYFSTPNIDRIANEGIKFENVYCANAICGPSRATIITGKYSHKNGFYKNQEGAPFDTSQWTFPVELKKRGYTTAMLGKWHLGTVPQGFDFYMYHNNPSQQGTYYNPLYNYNGTNVRIEGYATNITTDSAITWINRTQKGTKPFLLLLHYKAPHRSWIPDTTRADYKNMYPDTELPYPRTFFDNYKGREKTAGDTWMTMDYLTRYDLKMTPPEGLTGKAKNKWLWEGVEKGEAWMPPGCKTIEQARKWKYQRFVKDYLACVKSVDDNVGRLLDFLDENNLAENTIVIYTADQGFYLGDHGFFDKRFIYEPSFRMPFLMRYPAKLKAGQTNRRLISNVDFAPTLVDFAGFTAPAEVQGHSFKNILERNSARWNNEVYYHYYEYPFWHHVQPHYGMRTKRYKIAHFYYDIDVWELYDMEKDPDELHNVINDPAYSGIAAEMKKRLQKLMKDVGDTGTLDDFRKITESRYRKK